MDTITAEAAVPGSTVLRTSTRNYVLELVTSQPETEHKRLAGEWLRDHKKFVRRGGTPTMHHTVAARYLSGIVTGGHTLVQLESPYKGVNGYNPDATKYLAAALRDCLQRGEAPFASHAIYTLDGVLNDTIPAEREQGIEAGLAWLNAVHKSVVYTDLGVSTGMKTGIERALDRGLIVEYRSLQSW